MTLRPPTRRALLAPPVALAAAVLLMGFTCRKQEPVPTNNLSLPAAIAFLCLDEGLSDAPPDPPSPIAPADCDPPTLETEDVGGGRDLLVVLVLDLLRSEIVVVEDRVIAEEGGLGGSTTLDSRLVDSDISVPGFTYVRAGEGAVAIASATDGRFAYTANAGGCALGVFDATTALTHGHLDTIPQMSLPGRPTHLVVLPGLAPAGGDLLAVPLPDTGEVAFIDPAEWDGAEATGCAAPAGPGAAHVFARVPVGGTPTRLAYDASASRLFAADAEAAVLHVLDVSDPAAIASVDAPLPGRAGALAVSPDGAWLYVSDLEHGRLLLLDATMDPPALIPENFPDPYDPIAGLDFGGVIGDIVFFEIESTLGADPDATETTPFDLYGTFAALASTSGDVFFVNVDPTYPDRLREPSVDGEETATRPFQPPHTARNRLVDDQSAVNTAPRPFVEGEFVTFDPANIDVGLPVLATDPSACDGAAAPTLDVCFAATEFAAERDYGIGLLAGVTPGGAAVDANPGAERWTRGETWSLVWEGVLPDTERFDGRLLPGTLPDTAILEDVGAGFCGHGVLGEDGAGTVIGLLQILDPPAGDACPTKELEALSDIDDRVFPIRTATDEFLSVGPHVATTGGCPVGYLPSSDCFGEHVSYRVRLYDAYALTGTRTGYLHEVTADLTTGECIPGAAPDVGRVPVEDHSDGTAGCAHVAYVSNEIFETGLFYDACELPDTGAPPRGSGWAFSVVSGFAPLRIDVRLNPATGVNTTSNVVALYLAPFVGANELYVVDQGVQSVLIYELDDDFDLEGTRTID